MVTFIPCGQFFVKEKHDKEAMLKAAINMPIEEFANIYGLLPVSV
jgi:hypothetical protein